MYKIIAASLLAITLAGCGAHAVDEVQYIGPSETAFLVALDGNTKKNQDKLGSVDFLEADKISAKRVLIPHKIIDLCPDCSGYNHQQDVATLTLYKISRSPVSREWTSSTTTGTSAQNQAFSVESIESIDFDIGGMITAHVAEADTAKFLYWYSGKQLDEIMDTNIKTTIGGILAREFGKRTYDQCRAEKNDVFAIALAETRAAYAPMGITIDTLGYTEGMTPHDKKIQDAINAKFEADQQVSIADAQLQAAKKISEASDAVKIKQQLEIQMKEVEITMIMAQKWDGHGIMPLFVVSSDGKVNVNVPVAINK